MIMLVEVTCPSCSARFKAPVSMAGKKARCARCRTVFRLPITTSAASPLPTPHDGEPPRERPRYIRPGESRSNRLLVVALMLGLVALGSAVAAVIVMTRTRSAPPPTPIAKAEPTQPAAPPTPDPPAGQPPAPAQPPKPPTNPKPPTQEPPPRVGPPSDPGPPPGSTWVTVPATARSFQFRPAAAQPELIQPAGQMVVSVEAPFDTVKRIFPTPSRATHDTVVVWQSQPGVGGRGERLTVDTYSGTIGVRTGRFEYAGDGQDTKCDVSADGKLFAAVCSDGKLTVWNLIESTTVLEGFDPYADRPEHKKAGLAAVFFAAKPNHLVTVSTAGAVHLHDLTTRQRLSEFLPPRATAGRVRLGTSVAVTENRTSVAVIVAGVVHQITTTNPLTSVRQVDLGGDVSRSLGVAVLGTPGRIAFAFETGGTPKQQALMVSLPNEKPTFFLWPAAAGEPTGVAWSGANFAIVATTRGAVWIEAADKQFTPLALAEVAGGRGLHAATESAHWYLVPQPKDANRSLLVELMLPPEGLLEFRAAAEARQPLETVRLDDKGLSK
jgi:predicted Zn finger-like uncharacterized protein